MIHIESQEQFHNEIKQGFVIVDFFANWCGPCRMLSPVLEELEEEGIKVVKVNVDEQEELAMEYHVSSIPLLIYYKDGNKVGEHLGYVPKEALKQEIDKFVK